MSTDRFLAGPDRLWSLITEYIRILRHGRDSEAENNTRTRSVIGYSYQYNKLRRSNYRGEGFHTSIFFIPKILNFFKTSTLSIKCPIEFKYYVLLLGGNR